VHRWGPAEALRYHHRWRDKNGKWEHRDRGAKISTSPFEVVWEKDLYRLDVEDLAGNVLVFWGEKPE